MGVKANTACLIVATIILLIIKIEARLAEDKSANTHRLLVAPPLLPTPSTTVSLLDKLRNVPNKASNDATDEEGEEIDDEEAEDDDEELEEEDEEELNAHTTPKPTARNWTDMFGNQLKVDENRTTLVIQNKARDLGLLTLKAFLLGPLIGLTIKAALIRGLFWAVGAYLLHLFFPALLSSLGLGTGLVGFARQMQPSLAQMVLPHLANLTMCAIDRSQGVNN